MDVYKSEELFIMKNLKMTSLMMTKYGNINESLEFEKVSKPSIGSKQILIKTKAASYNPLDYKIIRGDFKSVRKIEFPKRYWTRCKWYSRGNWA